MPEQFATDPTTMPAPRRSIGLGALLGILIGTLVSVDAFISAYLPFGSRAFQWTICLWLAASVGLGLLGYWTLRKLWRNQSPFLLAMLVVAVQTSGLQLLGFPSPYRILLLTAGALFIFEMLTNEEFAFSLSPLLFLMGGMLFFTAVSVFFHSRGLGGLIASGLRIVVFCLIVQLFRDRSHVRYVVEAMVWGGIFSALVGVVQAVAWFATGTDLTMQTIKDLASSSPLGTVMRIPGLFNSPNILGNYLAVSMILALALAYSPYLDRWKRRVFLIGLLPMSVTLLLSLSRGSWTALAVIVVLVPFFLRPAWSIQILLAYSSVWTVLWTTGIMQRLVDAVRRVNPYGLSSREAVLRLGIESVMDHPFIGVGIGSFQGLSANDDGLAVHNAYVQMASEIGLFGGLCFALLVPFAIYRLIRAVMAAQPGVEKRCLQGLLIALAAVGIHMMGEPFATEPVLWVYLAIVEGSILVMKGHRKAGLVTGPPSEAL